MREELLGMFSTLRTARDKIQLSTHSNEDNRDGSDHGDKVKVPITSIHANSASTARHAIFNYFVGGWWRAVAFTLYSSKLQ